MALPARTTSGRSSHAEEVEEEGAGEERGQAQGRGARWQQHEKGRRVQDLATAGTAAISGLDPQAPVVVGIINGPRYNAAYADQEVCGGAMSLYICCYEEPRPWEGQQPIINDDGTATLKYDPNDPGSGQS